jgi:hypothetical protein
MERHISTITRADIFPLKDGVKCFSIDGPDGDRQTIRLSASGGRRRIRLIQFDFWQSEWNLGTTEAVVRFATNHSAYWERHHNSTPKDSVVWSPNGGGSTLTFSVLTEDAEEWIFRAARLLSDRANLVSIVPDRALRPN